MSQGKGSSSSKKGIKNDARRNGKASKKHPGVSPKAHNGKSVGGITIDPKTPETIARRKANAAAKAKRAAKRAAPASAA